MEALADFYNAEPLWTWMAVAAALLAAEVATSTGWLLWPSAAAAIVGLLTLATPLPAPLALLIFAVVTIIATLAGRRFMPRRGEAPAGDINDPLARLIGHKGRAATAFAQGEGRALVDGKEWPAALEGGGTLDLGAAVVVTGLSGSRLSVRPADPHPPGTP
jgi:membrane protein implicated in regulation of membrane protease activity